ncbi:MAG: hypothetical protein ACREN5_04035 [Gemmatimonadales bacterium]
MSGWRAGGRAAGLAVGLLAALPAYHLTAQFRISLGARHTSTLVRDSIVTPFTVRPALAPAVAVSFTVADREPWRAYGSADISFSQLKRHESGRPTFDIQGLALLAFGAELERRIVRGLDARLGLGGLVYLTDERGMFRLGAGGPRGFGALGARYSPPFADRIGLALDVRWDVHRFNTLALKNAGFLEGRLVNRVTVAVSRRVP